MMHFNEDKLLNLKAEIDSVKSTVSELKGQKTALMKQLKDDWGCITIDQAEKTLENMKIEIEKIENQIEKGTKELEEKYEL